MSLRITQGMIHTQMNRNISNNLNNMSKLENQMSTGRKINKASDDPVGMTFALRYRAELSENTQYLKNVNSGISQLDHYDTVLDQASQVMQRLKELVVQASNDTQNELGLDSVKHEVEQLKNQLIDIGNSTFNGKYIFNGQNSTEKLFNGDVLESTVEGNLDKIEYSISTNTRIELNLTSVQVFGKKNDEGNVFKVIENLVANLESKNKEEIGKSLTKIEDSANRFIEARAIVGARTNRLELMKNRLDDAEISLTKMQSTTEDADYSKLIIDAQISGNIYNASLSVGAQIIQKSLVDFLR